MSCYSENEIVDVVLEIFKLFCILKHSSMTIRSS